MKKILRIIGVVAAAVVVVLVVAAIILSLTFNPNRYKGEITQIVKAQTGRTLTIGGKISLSFFPWIGAEVGSVSLSNAPGFGSMPFAQVSKLGIRVKLLPLLRKKIEVDEIIVDGLRLDLVKNHAGVGNWQGLTKPGKPAPAAPARPSAPPVAGLFVNGVSVQNSEVAWDDQQTGKHYTVRNFDLQTGQLGSGHMTDVNLGFDLSSGSPPLKTRVTLKARLAVDLEKQTLDAQSVSLSAAGMQVRISDLKGTKIIDAPSFSGKLDIPAFNARRLMAKLGIHYDPSDRNALTRIAFSGPFSASKSALKLGPFRLGVDRSTLSGTFALYDFAHPAYRFNLGLDSIDLDSYLPRPSAAAGQKKQPPATKRPAVVLPLATLRALNVNGIIKIQKLIATNIHTSDVTASVLARNGLVVLNPLQAKLYGGSYHGSFRMDARGRVPSFSMNEKLQAVQVGPLLRDMQAFNHFTGTGNLAFILDSHGMTPAEITSNLNGNGSFSLRNGQIKGMNLLKIINETRAIAAQFRGKPVGAQTSGSDNTVFSSLTGTIHVVNGIAHNNDLVLDSPALAATGGGSANLMAQNLDYTMRVTIDRDNPSKRLTVPVTVRGPFSALKYSVDWSDIVKKQAEKAVKKELQNKLNEGLRRLLQ